MGDMRETWRLFNDAKRRRRDKYQRDIMPKDLATLEKLDVTFKVLNEGEHIIIQAETERGSQTIDYWPATGKWIVRGSGNGYGIPRLERYLHLKRKENEVDHGNIRSGI